MNYEESLKYLEELSVFGINLGLDRIRELLRLLGNPQKKYKTVHITGTNGKGSVTAMVSSVLIASKIRTGMFTSPHLVDYPERIQVNGHPVTREQFSIALSAVRDMCEFMTGRGQEQPTQFEALTAAAFLLFQSEEVEYAVIEVGLGGLLDSTNVIEPEVTAITNVAFEHADKCGGTLEGIAKHKAGIIKPGVPVITGAEGMPLDIIKKTAEENGCRMYIMGQDFEAVPTGSLPTMDQDAGTTFRAFSTGKSVTHKAYQMVQFNSLCHTLASMDYKLQLLGLHQVSNSSIALAICMVLSENDLRITRQAVRKGMAAAEWPGRFELIYGYGHRVVMDGAHNPAGVKTLRSSLDYYFPREKRVFVLGILKDKDFANMLKLLLRPEDTVVFTTPSSERAADPVDLLPYANCANKEAIGDPYAALKRGLGLTANDSSKDVDEDKEITVCAGSLYLIGSLRAMLMDTRSGLNPPSPEVRI